MGTIEPIVKPPASQPGVGRGWTFVSDRVAAELDLGRLARIWVFAPMRRNEREWGTAVIALHADGDRFEVHTAQYLIVTRGKKKGHHKVELAFVGESPPDVMDEVLQGVQDRTGEPDPPVEIDRQRWFDEDDDDEPAAQD